MIGFHLAVEMTFTADESVSDDEFEAFLDEVLAGFERIDRDVSLSARFAEHVADFAATIEAPDFEAAVNTFLADVRAALHAAGCGTARWSGLVPARRTVRELQDA